MRAVLAPVHSPNEVPRVTLPIFSLARHGGITRRRVNLLHVISNVRVVVHELRRLVAVEKARRLDLFCDRVHDTRHQKGGLQTCRSIKVVCHYFLRAIRRPSSFDFVLLLSAYFWMRRVERRVPIPARPPVLESSKCRLIELLILAPVG